jgi:hypothetical protein
VTGPTRIRTFSRPYAPFHDVYQRYYQEGLRAYARTNGTSFELTQLSPLPTLLRRLRLVRDRNYAARLHMPQANMLLDAVGRRLEGPLCTPSGLFEPTVGQYLLSRADGSEQRLCIDASDPPGIANEELRAWSDIYLKTNFWSERSYPGNVRPMVNGDPLMLGRLDELKRRRSAPKTVDLSFVVRIWGGGDGVEGIEHNLRLLEAIKRARCDKRLLAIVLAGDVEQTLRHLRRLGVPASTRGISPRELWELTAESRLNVFRLGLHYCVPWRMTGSLAVGSCIVLDRPPLSRWPEPLREQVNFLSLGALVAPGAPVATTAQYDEIPDRVEEWLTRPAALDDIGAANASYFDAYVEPEQVGRQIVAAADGET